MFSLFNVFNQASGAHSLKVRSNDVVAMYWPLGEISTLMIFPSCPWRVFNGCHVLLDQICVEGIYVGFKLI